MLYQQLHVLDPIALFSRRGLRVVSGIDADALAVLEGYRWPGNVRELENAIEYALTVSKGERISRADLPGHLLRESAAGANGAARVPTLEEGEKDLIVRALAATGGNKVHAARMLRISRHRLYDKLKKFAIPS
jgi:transcriptional regulator of acetoin/glycerol metabolism